VKLAALLLAVDAFPGLADAFTTWQTARAKRLIYR
jgi:hypothetical protein